MRKKQSNKQNFNTSTMNGNNWYNTGWLKKVSCLLLLNSFVY